MVSLDGQCSPLDRWQGFFIVDAPSSYNVIFWRPVLNSFQAIVSTFHMKMKFQVLEDVGEVSEDQYQARRLQINPCTRGWTELMEMIPKLKKCKIAEAGAPGSSKIQAKE
ncbi:hypothetical protein ACS0TY_014713 [Phlomoides rotata]